MRVGRAIAAAALLAALLGGCHTMRFELTDKPSDRVVYDRKSFLLWGLVPTRTVDVAQYCPNGVAAIRERTTFTDGLLAFITLDVWEPRSSWYYCLPSAAGE